MLTERNDLLGFKIQNRCVAVPLHKRGLNRIGKPVLTLNLIFPENVPVNKNEDVLLFAGLRMIFFGGSGGFESMIILFYRSLRSREQFLDLL